MSGMAAVKWVAALGAAFFFTSLGSILLEKLCLEKTKKEAKSKNIHKIDIQWKKNRLLWQIGLTVGLFCAGFCRGHQAVQWRREERSLKLEGQIRTVHGRVQSIRRKGENWVLILSPGVFAPIASELGELDKREQVQRIFVYFKDPSGQMGRPKVGSQIQITGSIDAFLESRNPGEFDQSLYYCSLGINYRMFGNEEGWQAMDDSYNPCLEMLCSFSLYAGEILDQVADSRDAGVFRAALLGEKSHLDEEIRELYQENGISHLLAISGLHLSLISGVVYGSLKRFGAGYKTAGILGGLFLAAYGRMTGASPSVIRALIMAFCGFLAAYMGRTYDLSSALALVALLILWKNPYGLYQAGVQLSFGAVGGISVTSEILLESEKQLELKGLSDQKKNGIQRKTILIPLGATIGMQLVTLPAVLYHFFQFPLYGVFLNLAAVPFMGIVVASGTAGILFGSIWVPAGRFAAGSGHAVLKFYDCLCTWWGHLPGSSLIVGQPKPWQTAVYLGMLAASLKVCKKGRWRRGLIFLTMGLMILMPLPIRGMEVTFLDVGQGDGICIRTKNTTILVDGGSSDQKQLGKNRLEPFFKSKGIKTVDFAIVSHGDQDHINGLTEVMENGNIFVGHLVLPAAGQGEEVYEQLQQLALGQGGRVSWMDEGDRLEAGEVKLWCLYPEKGKLEAAKEKDRNEHSLVLKVDYQDFHMLLTGDMSESGENQLLRQQIDLSEIQVLKVAHHGSKYSTSQTWIEAIEPRWAVISYGEKNRYGHPGQEVLDLLYRQKIQVYQTPVSGAVWLETDGKRIWWKQWISDFHP